MNWPVTIVVGIVLVAFFVLKRLSFVSPEIARKHLARSASVIDVRSPDEFGNRHFPNAVNIPLAELGERVPQLVKDKGQVLLLHCLSGGRSGIAKRQSRGMGYRTVFNLGSYGRAERILAGEWISPAPAFPVA